MAKAFLFDVDGVLTDSADISKELVKRYFSKLGKKVGDEDIIPNLGMGMNALFVNTAERVGVKIDLDEALSFFREKLSIFECFFFRYKNIILQTFSFRLKVFSKS